MPRNNDDFSGGMTVNVGPEGVHAMTKEGVSKVDLNTGKGLFIPFTMTSKKNPDISFTGSQIGEDSYNHWVKTHGEKWDFTRHDQ